MTLDEVRTADGRRFRVEPIDQTPGVTMPDEFEPRRLAEAHAPDRRGPRGGRARAAARARARRGPRPADGGPARVGGAGGGVEAAVVRVLRVVVPARLLSPHAVAHELGDRPVGARRRLDRAGERRRRARPRRLDPAARAACRPSGSRAARWPSSSSRARSTSSPWRCSARSWRSACSGRTCRSG